MGTRTQKEILHFESYIFLYFVLCFLLHEFMALLMLAKCCTTELCPQT
jgi:hypothetical protein